MKKVLLLINGSAGKMSMEKGLFTIVETLALGGYETTVYPIVPDKGIISEDIIKRSAGVYDMIVCGGGDGTLNHVINGVMDLDEKDRPVLGYLPAGSTNDFAKSIHIPEDLSEACKVLVDGSRFSYDIGYFSGKYFNYIAAFGAFSQISYSTDQSIKNALGHAAYVLNGLVSLQENIRYKCHMHIIADQTELEDDYLFGAIYSATSVGGFNISQISDVKLNDGKFELFLIKAPEKPADLNKITQALVSLDLNGPYISFMQVENVKIEADDNVGWTLDGEFGGNKKDVDIKVCHKAITIMTK